MTNDNEITTVLQTILFTMNFCKFFIWKALNTGWPKKRKPLPNHQKIVLYRVKACQWD